MAQVTGQMTMRNALVEVSFDNKSTWDDISGAFNAVDPAGGDWQTGETYTADGDTALIGIGKRQPKNVKIRVVYTEGVAAVVMKAKAAYDAGDQVAVRWSPKGGATGDYEYESGSGYITTDPLPGGEVQSGTPILVEFNIFTAEVASAVVT